jgi:hypothetical protein
MRRLDLATLAPYEMRELRVQGELQRIRKEMLLVHFIWNAQERTPGTLPIVPSKCQTLDALPIPQAGEVTSVSV